MAPLASRDSMRAGARQPGRPRWLRPFLIFGGLVLLIIIIVAISNTRTADATMWQQIATWSGNAPLTTERFTVSGEWAINWSATSNEYRTGYFSLTLYNGAGEYQGLLANTMRGGARAVYQHEGGTYYFEIDCGEPWSVQVWDKR